MEPETTNSLVSVRDAVLATFYSGVRSAMKWCKTALVGDLELPLTLNFQGEA